MQLCRVGSNSPDAGPRGPRVPAWGRRAMRGGRAAVAALLLLSLGGAGRADAQEATPDDGEALASETFDKKSLALRTALHYDPSVEAPLQSLLAHYRQAGRTDDLLAIYRSHLAQYPDDANAQSVLIRLLRETRSPEAGAAAGSAAQRFPDDAYIRYLHYQDLAARKDAAALEELSRALGLAVRPSRRRAWMNELITRAIAQGLSEVARDHFERFVEEQKQSPDALLELSRKMHEARLDDLALETVEMAQDIGPAPETRVDLILLAAKVEASQGKYREAGARLDLLLTKVAPDYWRRSEIMSERVHLLKTDADREKMLAAARRRFEETPRSESAALDLAELLVASELRRDALEVLLQASEAVPASEHIERKTLEILDRLGDDRSAHRYLEERIARFPERLDLRYRLVKALFLVGKPDDARAQFEALLGEVDEEEHLKQQIDLARFLRRMNQPADAVPVFERILKSQPERLDLLRELGETYLAVGRRDSARRLFDQMLPEDAEIENFLDLIQFLIQQDMNLEAASFLRERLVKDDGNFELRVLLVNALGKIGEQLEGEELMLSTRALADTLARYNRWLETAVEFQEVFDQQEGFFDAEQMRITDEATAADWSTELISRFLAFCDIAGRHKQEQRLMLILRERLEDESVPKELRPQLRRLLVDALKWDPYNTAQVQHHLAILMQEDAEREDEYKLRQAQIYHAENRPDLVMPLLEGIKIEAVEDPSLLSSAYQMFVDVNLPHEAMHSVVRLTELEPGGLQHWEKLLGIQASLGSEEKLRLSLRRLLAGLDKVTLSQDSSDALRLHLLDSYWRSIARVLAAEDTVEFGRVFAHLDTIEGLGVRGEDQLWVLWTRAYLLNRLGQERARDEALDLLQHVALRTAIPAAEAEDQGERKPSGESGSDTAAVAGPVLPPRISFPDGLSVSLAHALTRLREPPGGPPAAPAQEGNGPLTRDLAVRWAFDGDPLATIMQIEPAGAHSVLVLDDQGALHRIDADNGKLIWRERRESIFGESYRPPNYLTHQPAARSGRYPPSSRYISSPRSAHQASSRGLEPSRLRMTPRLVTDGRARIMIPAGQDVRCFSLEDGRLLWANRVAEEPPPLRPDHAGSVPPEMSLFLENERLFAFDPRSGIVAALDAANGKLQWRTRLEAGGEGTVPGGLGSGLLFPLNSGADYSRGNLVVYGTQAAVLSGARGEVTWSFNGRNVRTFPIALRTPDEIAAEGAAPSLAGAVSGLPSMGTLSRVLQNPTSAYRQAPPAWIDHLSSGQQRQFRITEFMKYNGALVAPALNWVQAQSQQMQPSRAALQGNWLLLMGPQRIYQLSLELPLAARQYTAMGTLVGFSGQRACFIRASDVYFLNLGPGTVEQMRIEGIPPNAETDAVLSGSRLYLTCADGIFCINTHTAKPLFRAEWPEIVRDGLAARAGISPAEYSMQFYWDGLAGGDTGKPGYCVPPRSRVMGDRLLTLVSSSRLVSLEPAARQ